ncbi:MAG: carbohydrate ABC transporter permease [Thermomicrobiales bacterium]
MAGRNHLTPWLLSAAAMTFCVIALFPPVWATVISFTPVERVGASVLPETWTIDNYRDVFAQPLFWESLGHSATAAVATTVLATILGIMAAFGMTRFRTRYDGLALTALGVRMIPGIVLIIPFYLLFLDLHLLDTIPGLVIVYLTFSLPFAIWMIRGFFLTIPFEIDEAAALDGAGDWGMLWRMHVPIAAPGILVTGVLVFLFCWNEFLFALILTDQQALTFLPLLTRFDLPQGPLYGQIFAGSTVFLLPPLIGLLLIRRSLSVAFGVGAFK